MGTRPSLSNGLMNGSKTTNTNPCGLRSLTGSTELQAGLHTEASLNFPILFFLLITRDRALFQKSDNQTESNRLFVSEEGDLMSRKDVIIAILTTFCLTATIFMIFPTRSAQPYDPWADVSGTTPGEPDGTINMRDVTYEILRFNSFFSARFMSSFRR